MVGSAVWRALVAAGHQAVVGLSSDALDLRERSDVFDFYHEQRPEFVVMAAAKVGGIMANWQHPVEFLSDNVRMQTNVLDAAHAAGVRRLLLMGSSCIYPKMAAQPIVESSLLTGALEPTNEAYAIAKITGVLHVQALRRQYGCKFVSAMPTNLYGTGDNFDPASSHVLPAMIQKFHEAKMSDAHEVVLWGTGTPRREFLHVDDLASATLMLLGRYDEDAPINVGTGVDLTISELAACVQEVTGFSGRVRWDVTKPDGTPRKLLDVSRLKALGWSPTIPLRRGITEVYRWYRECA